MRLAPVLAASLVVGLAVSGCGSSSGGGGTTASASSSASSNGIESMTAAQILEASKAAAAKQSSVHIAGKGRSSGTTFSIDMSMVKGVGGAGTITMDGANFQVVTTPSTLYFKADQAFWTKSGAGAMASVIGDKWVKVPSTDKSFGQLATLADFTTSVGQYLKPTGTPSKGPTKTIAGQPAISLVDSDGGSLWIATTGDPLPLLIESTSSASASGDGGGLTFSEWNQVKPPTVPDDADVLDLSKLAAG